MDSRHLNRLGGSHRLDLLKGFKDQFSDEDEVGDVHQTWRPTHHEPESQYLAWSDHLAK